MTVRFSSFRGVASAMLLFALCTLPLQPAKASTPLNDWFPWLFGPAEKGPKPEDTLRAPFADDAGAPLPKVQRDKNGKKIRPKFELPTNDIPINQAHRPTADISDWAGNTVISALSFDYADTDKHISDLQSAFSPYALDEYRAFLKDTNVLSTMTEQKLQINTIATGTPSLEFEGAHQGVYRWVFNIPALMSFFPSGTNSAKTATTMQYDVVVQVMIGRLPPDKAKSGDGIVVERWTVTGKTKKK